MNLAKLIAPAILLATTFCTAAQAREQVQVAGSSTVLPYATIVAEAFGENLGFPTPVVESGGSSAGLKRFCEGVGEGTIDIANASRAIREKEIAECAANGVTEIVEVRIGYDGIVFASSAGGPAFAFTPEHWWRALAAEVVVDGQVVPNPYTRWDQIDPGLPSQEIQAFVPGTKHGTREVFEEKVIRAGCEAALDAMAALAAAKGGEDAAKEACIALRTDGRSVDIDGDYTETMARIDANPDGIGVFGLSFYENNTAKLQVATMSGVVPTTATIASGEYPVSRPLYFYVKAAHLGLIPGLGDYAEFFLSDDVAGPGGPLETYGLVADPALAETRAQVAAAVAAGAAPAGETSAAAPGRLPLAWPLLAVLSLAALGFVVSRGRALAAVGGDQRKLHSLPNYYGWHTALLTLVPALLVLAAWLALAPGAAGSTAQAAVAIGLAGLGFLYGLGRTAPEFRARKAVEAGVLGLLILAASIAIVTTAGIVLSMLFETRSFFTQYEWTRFFFNTTWSPQFRGNSELGILPLLWGTLYVSFIALLVSVPVGLFAAIYMSEYAGPRFRAVAKPAIEILAGIPTIVYGLFALITVGPLLRDYFAQPLGLGASSSSVMTAGLVMGIMLIPFVSSLSDDIINAVPQAMRDGSLGLGATQSETIRQVVLPAALPGIVGAVLLAASRAIGETMIVVLGAGAAARLDLNPFEAMTTVTVKIVSQLTGDTDFASPETLVAFALGLTLFAMTLGLNVLALWIVRRYREQYE